MTTTIKLRQRLIKIARRDVGNMEETRNQAPWIKKYWPATHYPDGHHERLAYCAASLCYDVREWLKDAEVRKALGLKDAAAAEKWRCKSPSCFKAADSWERWAKAKGLLLKRNVRIQAGDIVIFEHSHIEIVSCPFAPDAGFFIAIGANTDGPGSNDGDGKWEGYREKQNVRSVIRMMP